MNPYREPVKREPWYSPGSKERWRKRRFWVRLLCWHDFRFVHMPSVCWAAYRCQKCRTLMCNYIPCKA